MGGVNSATTRRTVEEVPGNAVAIQSMPTGWTGGASVGDETLRRRVIHFVCDSV